MKAQRLPDYTQEPFYLFLLSMQKREGKPKQAPPKTHDDDTTEPKP